MGYNSFPIEEYMGHNISDNKNLNNSNDNKMKYKLKFIAESNPLCDVKTIIDDDTGNKILGCSNDKHPYIFPEEDSNGELQCFDYNGDVIMRNVKGKKTPLLQKKNKNGDLVCGRNHWVPDNNHSNNNSKNDSNNIIGIEDPELDYNYKIGEEYNTFIDEKVEVKKNNILNMSILEIVSDLSDFLSNFQGNYDNEIRKLKEDSIKYNYKDSIKIYLIAFTNCISEGNNQINLGIVFILITFSSV